jgi:hypothetical protein
MSTLKVSTIEAKAFPSSPTVDEKVTVKNSAGDILLVIDGKNSGITTVGINSTSTLSVDQYNNVNVTGVVTATRFSGAGAEESLGSTGALLDFYEIDNELSISTTTTVAKKSSNAATLYVKHKEIVVGTAPGTVELIVADGEELVVDALQLSVNTKDV